MRGEKRNVGRTYLRRYEGRHGCGVLCRDENVGQEACQTGAALVERGQPAEGPILRVGRHWSNLCVRNSRADDGSDEVKKVLK